MISFLSRHRRTLFIAVIAIFLIGSFVGVGGYFFTSRDTLTAVASVGSSKISYDVFLRRVNQYVEAVRDQGKDVPDDLVKQVKVEMLREMIIEEILAAKAAEMGIKVTDEELSRDIRSTPAFRRGEAYDQDIYFQTVRRVFRDTPQAYEEMRRKTLKANKLKQIIFQTAKVTPAELQQAYARENKGLMKDFDKKKQELENRLQQQRALDLMNYYLRQVGSQVEIRSYLDQRESGT